ncbi:Bidirectional sugar transporter SWEET2a [Zostera marina]|uniref:Bidirectional sugar transporter SWEET n=1 Tax=Zostera marina TaxID=29655 RepID=A0A0K9NQI0_ZOSMR|nr:Bidirectional sugar transporter SWEET2a [Zostera marina]
MEKSDIHQFLSLACGVAGNLFAIVLFVSPIPTFRRILRNKSTEDFSGLPYIYSLLNCLLCLWYGLPWVSRDLILIATVNSIGAIFQLVYVTIFIVNATQSRRMRVIGLLVSVFVLLGAIVYISLIFFDFDSRHLFIGYLTVASLISMFASPLFIINLVIRTKSVEFMPFYLSLSTLLMSLAFFAYGMLKFDFFVYTPNGIGVILGVIQLLLYAYYSRTTLEDGRTSLLHLHA